MKENIITDSAKEEIENVESTEALLSEDSDMSDVKNKKKILDDDNGNEAKENLINE